MLIFLIMLAIPDDQVIIYVSDPVGAYNERSHCPPCNRICRDLKTYKTTDGRFVIGLRKESMFRLVQAPQGMATPTIVYPGKNPIVGYSGDHATLIKLHPKSERIVKR